MTRETKERCSVCRQYRIIVKRLKTGISGTSHRFRQTLVCGDCDRANNEQYRLSQICHLGEQIKLIDRLMAEHPDTVASLTVTRAEYITTLAQLEDGIIQ